MNDVFFMQQCLDLAQKGLGQVSPNPMVGAIIVKNGNILAQGHHQKFGGPHAEIVALKKIHFKAPGATLYCNLEPCCHTGKTPPCVDAIIKSGISKVVIGQTDPNPQVKGRSIKILRQNGIKVITKVCEFKALELNYVFNFWMKNKRPYIILKMAMSLDGKIAPLHQKKGKSFAITGKKSHERVHQLRSQVDAILVGSQTVLLDDPKLNVRGIKKARQPQRIILDSTLKTPLTAKVMTSMGGNVIILCGPLASQSKKKKLLEKGITVWELKKSSKGLDLKILLKKLAKEGVSSVLVEGGSQVWASFLKARLVDEMIVVVSPRILGENFRDIFDLRFFKAPQKVAVSKYEDMEIRYKF